jgi:uncharacterized membrane protein (UPF0127 family)
VANWLAACVREPKGQFAVWNLRTETPVAVRLIPAFDSDSRRQGLLGRRDLAAGDGLVLAPCSSIHTAFMRFPIDLVFVARDGRVLKTAVGVPPWRIRLAWRAFAVVELAAGSLERSGTVRGDVLALRTLVSN